MIDLLHQMAARFAQLGWVFAVVIALEVAWPRERHSLTSRLRGATFWVIFTASTVIVAFGAAMGLRALGVHPLFKMNGWMPPAVAYLAAPLLAAFIGDFFFYWMHRAQHRWLWRFHSIHHSIRELNAINSYHHWTEELFRTTLMVIPMALLIDLNTGPAFPLFLGFLLVHGIYFHSPSRLHFGPLGRVLVDNRYHRIHHSLEARHFDRNFTGFTPLWDVIFGTAYFPAADEWPATGLADAPEPTSIVDYLARPFAPLNVAAASRPAIAP